MSHSMSVPFCGAPHGRFTFEIKIKKESPVNRKSQKSGGRSSSPAKSIHLLLLLYSVDDQVFSELPDGFHTHTHTQKRRSTSITHALTAKSWTPPLVSIKPSLNGTHRQFCSMCSRFPFDIFVFFFFYSLCKHIDCCYIRLSASPLCVLHIGQRFCTYNRKLRGELITCSGARRKLESSLDKCIPFVFCLIFFCDD